MSKRRVEPEPDLHQLPLWVEGDREQEVEVSGLGVHTVQPSGVGSRRSEPDALWSIKDVSSYLGVPVATIYQWRVKGDGPPATRMGKHLRYEPAVVRSWVREHREGA